MQRQGSLPLWLTVLTAMVVLSNFVVFGLHAFFFPNSVFPGLNDAGAYPVKFFAIRHIAFSLPLLHGLITKDRKILSAMYRIFMVIAWLDVGSVLYHGWSYPFIGPMPVAVNVAIGLGMFIVPMTFATWWLARNPGEA